MPDRPRVRVLEQLGPDSKLTFPTALWLPTMAPPTRPGRRPESRHVPVAYGDHPTLALALCTPYRGLDPDGDLTLPLCRWCIRRLGQHGLWPL